MPDATTAFEEQNLPTGTTGRDAEREPWPVAAELTRLYEAGSVSLPNAAFYYEKAIEGLNRSTLPSWVDTYLPRSQFNFERSRSRLSQEILSPVRAYIEDTGPKIVHTARTYELTDQENAWRINRIAEIDSTTAPLSDPVIPPRPTRNPDEARGG